MRVIVDAGETPDLFSQMFLCIIRHQKLPNRQGQSDQPIGFRTRMMKKSKEFRRGLT